MKINLLPLFSRLADQAADSGISLHQQQTWDALNDPIVDVVINVAMTGDGKSYAAFGAYPEGGILAMYPTNELVRDQQRQLGNYYTNPGFRIQRLTGYDLESWSRTAKQSKAETLLDLSETDILLTNPDLFYYLHQGNYIKDFLRQEMGERLDLWKQIDRQFQALIFDEFHIYQPSQVSGIINTLLLMQSVGIRHKYVFLSATPNSYLVKFLKLAGLNYRVIGGDYSAIGCVGWRQINQPVALGLEPTTRTEAWIVENQELIFQFFANNFGSKGAIILNSIALVKRISRKLRELLKPLGLSVSENTGFTDKDDAQKAINADLIVGTSTLDIGIDFKINFLIFEGHDAPTFIQRLGRVGRHAGFSTYQAYALVPQYFEERMNLEFGDSDAIARDRFDDLVIKNHRQVNSFTQYYKRWSPVQALVIGQQLKESPAASDTYRNKVEQIYGEDINKILWQCKQWTKESADLRVSNLIIGEAKSFRGTSSLQCAVLDYSSDKQYPTIKTYNLQGLLGGFKYNPLSKVEFAQKNRGGRLKLPSFVDHCLLHFEVLDINEKYNPWNFYLAEIGQHFGRLKTLTGINVFQENGNVSKLNKQLGKIAIACFIVDLPIDRIKHDLRLPIHFPVYGLKDKYSIYGKDAPYSIAFDQAALMLDAYLGKGEVINRDMISFHAKKVFDSEIEEDDKFMAQFFQQFDHELFQEDLRNG